LAELPQRPASIFSGRQLERNERIQIALLIAAAAGLTAFIAFQRRPEMMARDFTYPWRAAIAILSGQNPYDVIRPSGTYPLESWFMYPFTAVLPAIPFAVLPVQLAGALFAAVGGGALAWTMSSSGLGRFWILLSPSFLLAVVLAQWSPLLVAAAMATPLAWALTCKPTIGLALFTWRPTVRAAVICAAFVAVSFLVQPGWLADWLRNGRTVQDHYIPALRPFGFLALIVLVRWRRPEARLVALMTLVPQNIYFYDQLPLWLVARTGRSSLILTALAWVGWIGTWVQCHRPLFCGPEAEPWVLGLIYIPAALLVVMDGEMFQTFARWRGRVAARRITGGAPP
jgi:hypothetical protein